MKIVDLKCALIGNHPIIRVVTDEGISGYAQIEHHKAFIKPHVLSFREALIGADPTDVERVMLRIRQRGAFKPYGSAVSAIEMALWDIAGKAAGLPVYKLLGGKVRDRGPRLQWLAALPDGGLRARRIMRRMCVGMMALPEGFTIIKQPISFHSPMKREVPGYYYGEPELGHFHGALDRGVLTERGLAHTIDCVAAMKEVLGDRVGLALDCGPGWMLSDAIRFARAVEPYNLMWLEDMLTGDYIPYVHADMYRELTLLDLHAHPYRRADLPAAELQGPDREEGGARHRPRPLRCRGHRRTEMDCRICRSPWRTHRSSWHRQWRAGPCCARSGLRDAASQFHRLRISRRPTHRGGTTSSRACHRPS